MLNSYWPKTLIILMTEKFKYFSVLMQGKYPVAGYVPCSMQGKYLAYRKGEIMKKEKFETEVLTQLATIKKDMSDVKVLLKGTLTDKNAGLCGEVQALKEAKTIFMWVVGINFMLLAGLLAVLF